MTTVLTEPVATTTAFYAATSRDALESATKFIAAALPARAPIPVLNGVLLEATDDGITVSGFDYELATRQRIAGFGQGRVLVSGKLLKDMVAKLAKGGEVTMVVNAEHLDVRCGNRTYTLPLLSIEDYPDLLQLAPPVAVIAASDLANLTKVTVAAGRDDTLPILTAVRFDFDAAAGTVTAAATDRYRLARLIIDAATMFTGFAQVPASAVDFAVKHLAKLGNVTIGVEGPEDQQYISFSAGDREITVRGQYGTFPAYRKLLPEVVAYAATLEISAAALLNGIDGAKVAVPRNSSVRLSLDETGATMHAGSTGEAQSSEFLGGTYTGEPMIAGYNPAYLADGIRVLGTDTVRFSLTLAGKPVILTSTDDPAGDAYLYLLMPIRLSS